MAVKVIGVRLAEYPYTARGASMSVAVEVSSLHYHLAFVQLQKVRPAAGELQW